MIVASLASLHSREQLLAKTIESLASQVDAICVYGNGYPLVPDCLKHPKVLHAILSADAGWRGAEAKLWFWDEDEFRAAPRWSPDDIALICDDDIVYPSNYVKRMTEELGEHPGSVVCVHGSIMTEPFERYATSRMVARTVSGLKKTTRVHIPGTGTLAFRVGDVAPAISLRKDFRWSHAVDPHVAAVLNRRQIPVWSVARPPRWLTVQQLPAEGMRIFTTRTGAANDQHETQLLKDAGPWPELEIAKDMTPRASQVNQQKLRVQRDRHTVTIVQNPDAELPSEAMAWLAPRLATLTDGFVVELGSGFGTAKLLEMLPEGVGLVSVEHDKAFVDLVTGSRYIHAPIRAGWYDPRVLRDELPPVADIRAVIVDGPPAKIGRKKLLKYLGLFPEGVPMLFDDAHREQDRSLARSVAVRRHQDLELHHHGHRSFATVGWADVRDLGSAST
jgi:hypothetical protein